MPEKLDPPRDFGKNPHHLHVPRNFRVMSKLTVKNVVWASVPILLLATLIGIRIYGAYEFVLCGSHRCQSIADNLGQVFVADNPNDRIPLATDTAEQRQRRAIQNYEVAGQRYGGRLSWVFMASVCALVCFAAYLLGCYMIYTPLHKGNPNRIAWLIAAVFLSAAVWIFLHRHPEYHMPLLQRLLPNTLETDVHGVARTMSLLNSFAFAAAFHLILAMVSILLEIETLKKSATSLNEVAQGMKRLQTILYASTLMLVVGILLERSVLQWVVTFMSHDEPAVKVAQNFMTSILAIDGGFFTLALALTYLPSAAIVRSKAERLEQLPKDETEREKVLQGYGLNFSFTESIPRLVAILAPLLAGPVGELFGRLAK
jgi:hypothetical protein